MATTVREIYQYPEVRENLGYRHRLHTPLDDVLDVIEVAALEPSMVDFLDEMHREDSDQYYDIKNVITNLPAVVIFENYGEEVLAWAAANAGTLDTGESLREGLHKLAGYDEELFEKSRLWVWRVLHGSKGRDVLSQYALGDTLLREGALESLDLAGELQAAAKTGVTISEQRAGDYELIPVTTDDKEPTGYIKETQEKVAPNIEYDIWLDAPVGFMLSYKGRPQAVVGFSIKDEELVVYQLQGVKGALVDPKKKYRDDYIIKRLSSRGLMPIDWQKLMISVTTQIASNIGLKSVGIQTGAKQYWANHIKRGETEPHLSPEAAHSAYDAPAQRLGFSKGADENWHLML